MGGREKVGRLVRISIGNERLGRENINIPKRVEQPTTEIKSIEESSRDRRQRKLLVHQ